MSSANALIIKVRNRFLWLGCWHFVPQDSELIRCCQQVFLPFFNGSLNT